MSWTCPSVALYRSKSWIPLHMLHCLFSTAKITWSKCYLLFVHPHCTYRVATEMQNKTYKFSSHSFGLSNFASWGVAPIPRGYNHLSLGFWYHFCRVIDRCRAVSVSFTLHATNEANGMLKRCHGSVAISKLYCYTILMCYPTSNLIYLYNYIFISWIILYVILY